VSNASMTSSIFSFVSAFCSAKLQHATCDMLVVWQQRCAAEAAISPHRCVRVSVGLQDSFPFDRSHSSHAARAARQARRPWRTSFVAHRPSPRPAVQSHPIPFQSTRCTSQARAAAPRSGADRIGSRGNGRWLRGHSSAGGWKEADALRRRRRWHREGDLLLQQLHRHEPFLRRAQLLRSDAATHDTMQRTTYAVQPTTRNMQSRSCNGNRATCHIGKSVSWTIGPEGRAGPKWDRP
jgi:hypothetical protein